MISQQEALDAGLDSQAVLDHAANLVGVDRIDYDGLGTGFLRSDVLGDVDGHAVRVSESGHRTIVVLEARCNRCGTRRSTGILLGADAPHIGRRLFSLGSRKVAAAEKRNGRASLTCLMSGRCA